jgi:hypothetical protein
MNRRVVVGGILGAVLVAALGYSTWRFVSAREQQVCGACRRPIHGDSRTVATVAGRTVLFCCPSCALSERQQSGAAVRVTGLTNFLNGQRLDPSGAFLVRGSDVNPCAGHGMHLNPDKQPMETQFDRCAPSLLAFSGREEAQAFAQEHGGQVIRFTDLVSEHQR